MSTRVDFSDIANEFVECIQKFFPPNEIECISPGYGAHNGNLRVVRAVVNFSGGELGSFDGERLLDEISGKVVENTGKNIVVEGKYLNHPCHLTITTIA